MPTVPCCRCKGIIADNVSACPACGAPQPRAAHANAPTSPIGVCFRCRQPAFVGCPDCGRYFCHKHGGMDWARYLACNHCRGMRKLLLLVILPAALLFFVGILLLIRHVMVELRRQ
jgi:hypothetical protein